MAHCGREGDITVLQLDAHSDLRDEYDGSKYNHACVMARVRELAPVVQVGIRSMDSGEKQSINSQNTFFAEDICSGQGWIENVVGQLSDKVYITIDLDVFDISIMPFVGTPEPGGLLWYDVLALLRTVFEKRQVMGFDVVELCPNEYSKAFDFLAAKLVYKLLGYKFTQ
jgi:agmatinase